MIDRGSGVPVVLIPGLQGRWEWMAPAVDALARRCRCITYSLCGEPESGARLDPALGLEGLARQLDDVLDRTGVARAVICGVSFGGRIAVRYAATRPRRTMGLALVSVPGPSWRPDERIRRHLRWPRLLAPVFVATSPRRLAPEIVRAFPDWRSRLAFSVRHTVRVLAAPMSAARMADRARLLTDIPDCAGVRAPTLVVTGEPGLDKVVSVASTCEYIQAIPGARCVMIEATGHIGLVTKAERFAEIVAGFAEDCALRLRAGEAETAPRLARGVLSPSSLDWARDDPELVEGSKDAETISTQSAQSTRKIS